MYHQRLQSLHSPLSPIPPMRRSPFDFSPSAVNSVQSSNPMGLTSSTPDKLNISSPNVSPIKLANSPMQQLNLSNSSVDIDMDSFNKRMDSLSFEFDGDQIGDDSLNKSNINNHHLNVSMILDELGLNQYKTLFQMQEIDLIAFFLLTDEDLLELGITDLLHREIFKSAIKMFCGI